MPGKGASIGEYFCTGLIWGENVGWIQLGTGAPADGVHDTNTDVAYYGVNHDGLGTLSGLVWGENIGWVKFDQSVSDPPRGDLATGKLRGYAYGENIGWIDLGSNGTAFVTTTFIDEGRDTDLDMIADAWELEQAAGAGLGWAGLGCRGRLPCSTRRATGTVTDRAISRSGRHRDGAGGQSR